MKRTYIGAIAHEDIKVVRTVKGERVDELVEISEEDEAPFTIEDDQEDG